MISIRLLHHDMSTGPRPPHLPSALLSTEHRILWQQYRPLGAKLLITLWLTAVIPTLRRCLTSSTIIRAPVNVLPDPGGPWIGSTDASRGQRMHKSPSRLSIARRLRSGSLYLPADRGRSRSSSSRSAGSCPVPLCPGQRPKMRGGERLSRSTVEPMMFEGTSAVGCGTEETMPRLRSIVRLCSSMATFFRRPSLFSDRGLPAPGQWCGLVAGSCTCELSTA